MPQMIFQGKKGSLVFYFNNKIVGSLPLGKRSLQDYEKSTQIWGGISWEPRPVLVLMPNIGPDFRQLQKHSMAGSEHWRGYYLYRKPLHDS